MPRTLSLLVILLLGIVAAYLFLPADTVSLTTVQSENAETQVTTVAKPAITSPQAAREQAAKALAEQVTAPAQTPIDMSQAQHFVSADQLLALPKPATTQPTLQLQPAQTTTGNSAPISAQSDKNDNAAADVSSYGVNMAPFTPTNSVSNQPAQMPTLPANITANEAIQRTVPTIAGAIQLRELLDNPEGAGRIFYIHSVNQNDAQGIWGILQKGLTQTFAKGIQLKQADVAMQAVIPEEADEVLENKQSSFLGRLLHDKAQSTYIYNYQQGLVGQNPNLIKPGQQLIIVTFTEEELLDIYQHFNKAPR